jgi:hypothetical protein
MPKTISFDTRKAAILTRAIQPEKTDISPAAARAILRFQLAQPDREYLEQLLTKNQEDLLTAEEREQLDDYLTIGMLLDLLLAKARAARKKPNGRPSRSHG